MRGSRIAIWLYLGMAGVPILMFLFLVSNFFVFPYVATIRTVLLVFIAIGFIVLGTVGIKELLIHKRDSSHGITPSENIIRTIKKEGPEHATAASQNVTVRIKRFNNETKGFDVQVYKIKSDRLNTVLGALLNIKDYVDPTLAIRYSCRMGICGSCGMVVNGKPVLACETNLLNHLDEKGEITVEPMQGHPLLKDLVTDFDDFFERHRSVNPNLDRKDVKEQYAAKQLYKQTKEQEDKFLPYSFCIMCGLCLDACPVVNSNPNFIGPQALSQVYRYHADSRDQAGVKRLLEVDTLDGVWGCEFAGSCSKACPKGVDPASAIQLLKSEVIENFDKKEEE